MASTKTLTSSDFRWTRWTAGDIKKLVPKILAHKKRVYAAIKKIPADKRTFENTVFGIESSLYPFTDHLNHLWLLKNASPDKTVRAAATAAIKELDKKLIDIEYDEKLYRAVSEYAKRKERLAAPEDRKLLKDMLTGYRRMGFELPLEKRAEAKRILKELSKLSLDFSKNINDYKDHITVTREELDGLPENYIAGLKKDRSGRYLVSLEYPDLVPFMQNAERADKRRELSDKNLRKGGLKNMRLLGKILKLRHKHARILGYKNHADYQTETRMVRSGKAARRFVDSLLRKLAKAARRDLAAFAVEKRHHLGRAEPLRYYDLAYYMEKARQRKFKLSSEKIREYFPLQTVLRGTFTIYQKLFGVKFAPAKGYHLWHPDVLLYAILERGRTVAHFALDLYPREGKYGHACVGALSEGRLETKSVRETYHSPFAAMLANFPKPRPNHPALLSHNEVETFFHEFGHLMHATLTRAKYLSQSGYHTKWDFAEAPSQMLENWVWDEKTLRLLSRHYKTGATLPKKMLRALLRSKKHTAAYLATRQLNFAIFDLILHSKNPPKNSAKLYNSLVKKYTGISMPEKAIFPAGFGHLMGYDAGYYGYMWSKVYAADMFTRFKKEGLLNPKTGRDYRREILEVGGSREEITSVKKFLGRIPNNKAFLKEIGL